MRERRDSLGFALEAGERRGVGGEVVGQHLDRHVPTQARVAGAVDLAHSTCPEQGEDLVGAEPAAGPQRHGCSQAIAGRSTVEQPPQSVKGGRWLIGGPP